MRKVHEILQWCGRKEPGPACSDPTLSIKIKWQVWHFSAADPEKQMLAQLWKKKKKWIGVLWRKKFFAPIARSAPLHHAKWSHDVAPLVMVHVHQPAKNSPYTSICIKQVTHMLVHGEFLTFSFTGAILLCVICRASSIPPHSQSRCHLAWRKRWTGLQEHSWVQSTSSFTLQMASWHVSYLELVAFHQIAGQDTTCCEGGAGAVFQFHLFLYYRWHPALLLWTLTVS